MKNLEEILLNLKEECFIEAHFVENENVGMHGLFWTIDFINAIPENEPELTLELNLDSIDLEINNWRILETIKLTEDDDIPLFYDSGNGSCYEVEESELIISERINNTFRVQVKGIIDRNQLLHYLDNCVGDEELQDMEEMKILIDTRMKFKGITINKEFLNNESPEEFLSEFFQTDNLIITESDNSFFFKPQI